MYYEKAMSYMEATGVIAYNMTNNYMFRFILQQNKKVLKGLICALLHLKPERSLNYLCRSFDHLYSGQKYEEVSGDNGTKNIYDKENGIIVIIRIEDDLYIIDEIISNIEEIE